MKVFWKITPVILTAILIAVKEWEFISQINEVLFGNFHDALKNYYTFLYHIKWDQGYTHFEGMNYPFGEHVLFTDNQPIIAFILKFIEDHLFPVSPYLIGIFNALMYISFLFTVWFCNLVMLRLGAKPWFAAAVALGVTFLSPQISRIWAHFALSYSFIIPLLFYLGIRQLQSPSLRRSWLIALLVSVFSLVHAYYLGFSILIFGCLFLVATYSNVQSLKYNLYHLAIQVIAPFVAIQAFMSITDGITDRPPYPWSPFMGNFIPQGLIISYNNPIGNWLTYNLKLPYIHWEAEGYLGLFTIFFLVFAFLYTVLFMVRKIGGRPHRKLPIYDPPMLFLAFSGGGAILISLVFSLLSGDVDLYQLMGPFRQFRAVGRFYWVSVFAFNFIAFTWLIRWVKSKGGLLKWGALSFALGFLAFDAYFAYERSFHETHQQRLLSEGSSDQTAIREHLIGKDLIIPVPYFHIGSEDFVVTTEHPRHYKNAMAVSYATGMPMTANALSRTSLAQTLELLNYRYWPVAIPNIWPPEAKAPVLLVDKDAPLSLHEQLMLESNKTDTLVNNPEFVVLGFDYNKYQKAYLDQDSITHYFTSNRQPAAGVFRQYEDDSPHAHSGTGAKVIGAKGTRLVDSFAVLSPSSRSFKISFWVYLNQHTKAIEEFYFEFSSATKGKERSDNVRIANELLALDGNWGYVESNFTLPESCDSFTMFMKQNNLHGTPTYIDDLKLEFLAE